MLSLGFRRGRVRDGAGASSKLTLEIVCVRLAINDGGLGSVADIAISAASAVLAARRDTKISKCKNLSLHARVGCIGAYDRGSGDKCVDVNGPSRV